MKSSTLVTTLTELQHISSRDCTPCWPQPLENARIVLEMRAQEGLESANLMSADDTRETYRPRSFHRVASWIPCPIAQVRRKLRPRRSEKEHAFMINSIFDILRSYHSKPFEEIRPVESYDRMDALHIRLSYENWDSTQTATVANIIIILQKDVVRIFLHNYWLV